MLALAELDPGKLRIDEDRFIYAQNRPGFDILEAEIKLRTDPVLLRFREVDGPVDQMNFWVGSLVSSEPLLIDLFGRQYFLAGVYGLEKRKKGIYVLGEGNPVLLETFRTQWASDFTAVNDQFCVVDHPDTASPIKKFVYHNGKPLAIAFESPELTATRMQSAPDHAENPQTRILKAYMELDPNEQAGCNLSGKYLLVFQERTRLGADQLLLNREVAHRLRMKPTLTSTYYSAAVNRILKFMENRMK